jgi:hypothetical protein
MRRRAFGGLCGRFLVMLLTRIICGACGGAQQMAPAILSRFPGMSFISIHCGGDIQRSAAAANWLAHLEHCLSPAGLLLNGMKKKPQAENPRHQGRSRRAS